MEIQVWSPRDCPVGCPGRQSAYRSPSPWLNFCEGAETQSQREPGKSGAQKGGREEKVNFSPRGFVLIT